MEIIGYLIFLGVGYYLGSRRQDTKKEGKPLVKLFTKNSVKILKKRVPQSLEKELIDKIDERNQS